jgi:mannose-6-phosphate isomerase-like protein (cupin superfamily)
MLIRKLQDCPEFIAGDETRLRELLHPGKQPLDLRYSLAHAVVPVGESSKPHRLKTSEVYYILSGRGEMHIDAESQIVEAGDVVYIPPHARQFVCNLDAKPFVFLCIVDPAWQAADEIVEA